MWIINSEPLMNDVMSLRVYPELSITSLKRYWSVEQKEVFKVFPLKSSRFFNIKNVLRKNYSIYTFQIVLSFAPSKQLTKFEYIDRQTYHSNINLTHIRLENKSKKQLVWHTTLRKFCWLVNGSLVAGFVRKPKTFSFDENGIMFHPLYSIFALLWRF